jgi:hypothetical protein
MTLKLTAAVKGTVVNGGSKPAIARLKYRVLHRLTDRGSFSHGMPAFVRVSSYDLVLRTATKETLQNGTSI